MSNSSSIKVIDVTPELAESWLGKNTHNRNLRERTVNAYARDMRDGNWKWNGEAIKFDKNGILLDGQHRLHAVIKAGITVQMLVIFGVESEAQHTMDSGTKRTLSDALKFHGEQHTTALGAGIKSCVVWDSGYRQLDGGAHLTPTNGECLEYLADHPELREYARLAGDVRKSGLPSGVAILAMKIFYEIDAEDAEFFFMRLASDEGHYKTEPIYELRSVLDERGISNGRQIVRRPHWKLAVTIKAWNAYRAGIPIKRLSFRVGGAKPEKFPTPM